MGSDCHSVHSYILTKFIKKRHEHLQNFKQAQDSCSANYANQSAGAQLMKRALTRSSTVRLVCEAAPTRGGGRLGWAGGRRPLPVRRRVSRDGRGIPAEWSPYRVNAPLNSRAQPPPISESALFPRAMGADTRHRQFCDSDGVRLPACPVTATGSGKPVL